jgi:hypothetical protein
MDDTPTDVVQARLEHLLDNALQLSRICPNLDKEDVLWAIGMAPEESESAQMKKRLRQKILAYNQAHGMVNTTSREERVFALKTILRRHPTKTKKHGSQAPKLTDMMKFFLDLTTLMQKVDLQLT